MTAFALDRHPTDLCFICLTNAATKTNSHIIPVGLLKRSVGKRNKEEAYLINGSSAKVDAYFGKEHLANTSEEIKQDIHARDFYFCSTCENKLGKLESSQLRYFAEKLRNDKYKEQFLPKVSPGGINYIEIPKAKKEDFLVFVYSLIWRLALLYQNEYEVRALKPNEMEDLRNLLYNHLYNRNTEAVTQTLGAYSFALATASAFGEESGNFASTVDFKDNPNIFFIYEFVVLLHSSEDAEIRTPFLGCMNYVDQSPKIVMLSHNQWLRLQQPFLELLAENYLDNLVNYIALGTGKTFVESQTLLQKELSNLEQEKISEDNFSKRCEIASERIIRNEEQS